ncbi:MAG: deoxyhypusine synthase family protein [Nitrospinae bacterium]|nr:deoxyhypusine synthase family protein [Nitrospinota bacterium]
MVFDRSRLKLEPLDQRQSDLDLTAILDLTGSGMASPGLDKAADRIRQAKERGAAVIFIMGAHVIRSGVQRYIIDLMARGYISLVATNGAGAIHDYEFALTGKTTESVARYVSEGRFGLWRETGRVNDIAVEGWRAGLGLGEAVGKAIEDEKLPHRDISVFAAGYRLGVPVTAHVGIGYDIVHEHPNCDGAAYGATSYTDFLKFAAVVEKLEGGVVMNFGSAVMGPEVYLKALAMARNVAHSEGRRIRRFTTLVCDLHDIGGRDYGKEPQKGDPAYYYRPWKTMLARTVADGGESIYVQGAHAQTIPALWARLAQTGAKP